MAQDDHAVKVIETPQYNQKTTNKPVYIVSTECLEMTGKIGYYRGTIIHTRENQCILIKGHEITKKESEQLRADPNTEIESKKEISVEVPWNKIIRIISIGLLTK